MVEFLKKKHRKVMGNFSSQVFFKEHQIKMIKVIEDMNDIIPKVYLTVIS